MVKAKRRSLGVALLFSLGGAAACSSSSGEASGSNAAEINDNAQNCPTWKQPLDTYSPELSREGTSGAFQFVVTDIAPAPPSTGVTTWQLKLLDASGQPVKDATFPTIKTWMPQHMHSSTAQPLPTNNGDGTYTVGNIYFFMPGVWQVTFNAQSGSTTDSAVFTLCIGT
jgi:hypothetical protein